MAHHRTRSPPPPSEVNGWKKPTLLGTRLAERRYVSTPPRDKRTMDTVQWSVQSHTGGTISSSAMSFVLVLLFGCSFLKKGEKTKKSLSLSLSLPLSLKRQKTGTRGVCVRGARRGFDCGARRSVNVSAANTGHTQRRRQVANDLTPPLRDLSTLPLFCLFFFTVLCRPPDRRFGSLFCVCLARKSRGV